MERVMLYFQYTHLDFLYFECIADAATIIVVNLYIRSFAKIDDVKMVNSIFLFRARTLNSNTCMYVFIYFAGVQCSNYVPSDLE